MGQGKKQWFMKNFGIFGSMDCSIMMISEHIEYSNPSGPPWGCRASQRPRWRNSPWSHHLEQFQQISRVRHAFARLWVSHNFCLLILANPFRTLPLVMEILEMMTEMTEMVSWTQRVGDISSPAFSIQQFHTEDLWRLGGDTRVERVKESDIKSKDNSKCMCTIHAPVKAGKEIG